MNDLYMNEQPKMVQTVQIVQYHYYYIQEIQNGDWAVVVMCYRIDLAPVNIYRVKDIVVIKDRSPRYDNEFWYFLDEDMENNKYDICDLGTEFNKELFPEYFV